MGYQPKFAPKGPKKPSVWFILLGILIVPLSLMLTGKLLLFFYNNAGHSKTDAPGRAQSIQVAQKVDDHVAQRLAGARAAISSDEDLQAPPETIPPPRVIYTIDETAPAGPKPNPDCYGETTDPAVLEEVLEKAKYLLGEQTMYFYPNRTRFEEDPAVRYYLDDSILAVTWKEVHDESVYTFSEIKVAHPSQFRRHLAGGVYGGDIQYLPTEMAPSVNAVVASSGDFYRFRDFGVVVYEGKVRKVNGTYAETCMIDRSGNLQFVYPGQITTTEAAQQYADENDIWFSLAFGPILVDNGQPVDHDWYGVGEINDTYARAALCQMDELHYLVATANTESPHFKIPTVEMFRNNIQATGCKMAYCLDGGQTATIVMMDQLVNRPVYGQQRKMSDILYFATAIPEGAE